MAKFEFNSTSVEYIELVKVDGIPAIATKLTQEKGGYTYYITHNAPNKREGLKKLKNAYEKFEATDSAGKFFGRLRNSPNYKITNAQKW
jgi:hypothetical protein